MLDATKPRYCVVSRGCFRMLSIPDRVVFSCTATCFERTRLKRSAKSEQEALFVFRNRGDVEYRITLNKKEA